MLPISFILSEHAVLRMSQRNCSPEDIEYVLTHGEPVHGAGVTTYFLAKKNIPKSDQKLPNVSRREGIIVLTKTLEDGRLIVITVYRNRDAFKTVRQKHKYDSRKPGSYIENLGHAR